MSTKVVCPDCGGVIGVADPGEASCTCFPSDDLKSDTDTFDALPNKTSRGKSAGTGKSNGEASGADERLPGAKRCIVCGKDVAGHRRIKDSRGYTCYACAKAERAAEREGKVACKECRKLIRPEGLVAWEGKMICRTCWGDHQETARFKKKVDTKHYDVHEKQRIIALAVVFGILAIIVVWQTLKRMIF